MPETVRLFCCYAAEDDMLREALERHLSSLKHEGLIESWHDKLVLAGTNVQSEIVRHLDAANMVLLLISSDFMASPVCQEIATIALQRHEAKLLRLVPILARPVDWGRTTLASLSPLPAREKPITLWADRDEAWLSVVLSIRKLLKQCNASLGYDSEPRSYHRSPSRVRLFAGRSLSKYISTRWILVTCVSVLLFIALFLLMWPPLPKSFLLEHHGIVIIHRWLGMKEISDRVSMLCQIIKDAAPQQEDQACRIIPVSLWSSRRSGKELARRTDAELSILVTPDGKLSIELPSNNRGLAIPIEYFPSISINDDPAIRSAAQVLDLLNRLYSQKYRKDRCIGRTSSASVMSPIVALAAGLLDWQCHDGRFSTEDDAAKYADLKRRLCGDPPLLDQACALAMYFAALALDCSPNQGPACEPSVSDLHRLAVDATDAKLRFNSRVELVRRVCTVGSPEAAIHILALAGETKQESPCVRSILAALTPCVLGLSGLSQELREQVQVLEQEVSRLPRECGSEKLARSILTERGLSYVRRGEYKRALESYKAAFTIEQRSSDALWIGELLLLLGQPEKVRNHILLQQQESKQNRAQAAFLIWLSDGETHARTLLRTYEDLDLGEHGLQDVAGTLQRFSCREPGSQSCYIYEIMLEKKSMVSTKELCSHLKLSHCEDRVQ